MAIRKIFSRLLYVAALSIALAVNPLFSQTLTTGFDETINASQENHIPTPAELAKIVSQYSFPGGIVELHLAKNSDVLPQVQFGTYEPIIIEQQDHWRVLIGLALSTLPGEYVVYVKEPDSEAPAYNVKFTVTPKIYSFSDTTYRSPTSQKNLNHRNFSDLDFLNTNEPALPLMLPIDGHWADYFGRMSHENNKGNNKGIIIQNLVSLTATEIKNVVAPQNSIVSRIIYNGELPKIATVFLDHGRGLYSIISGIDNLAVELGDGVLAGAIIGRLPANNIKNQPSTLSWQCVLNNAYINPLILTDLE